MNANKITTLVLLLFVVASIGTIVAKEKRAAEPFSIGAPAAVSKKSAPVNVVVYYFHGNMRCHSCKLIESYTVEAIGSGFKDDIKSGRVKLKIVNVEEPGNEHYIQDYQLAARSVVMARYESGQQKDWKRLDEIWQLVRDKDAFIRFVQEQATHLLKGQT